MSRPIRTLYICVGLIGSGKSTWARENAKKGQNTVIVNRDHLRTMLLGKYRYDKRFEPIIKNMALDIASRALTYGLSVVIDETCLTRSSREGWVSTIAAPYDRCVAVHFTNTEGNVDRRMADDPRGYSREKWQEVYDGMLARFEPITEDEGFDEVIEVSI